MWPASHGQSSWRAHSRAHGDCETRGLPGFSSPLRFSTCPISLFSISSSELLEDQEQPKPGTKLVLQSTARAVVCLSQCKGSWASSSQGSSQSGTHSSGSSPIWLSRTNQPLASEVWIWLLLPRAPRPPSFAHQLGWVHPQRSKGHLAGDIAV